MLDFNNQEWRHILGITITDHDVVTLNREVYDRIYNVDKLNREELLEEIEDNIRGFNSAYGYADYVYNTQESMVGLIDIITNLVENDQHRLFLASDILYDDDDISLDNGKIVLVMN